MSDQRQGSLEPVRKTRHVPLPPAEAFDLFTSGMGTWWLLAEHSIAGDDVVELRFEGRVGGRVVEVARDGTECAWADVLAWDPPHRLVLSWHPNPDPVTASVLEIRVEAEGEGSLLTLVHGGWEAYGEVDGAMARSGYQTGWDGVLDAFDGATLPH